MENDEILDLEGSLEVMERAEGWYPFPGENTSHYIGEDPIDSSVSVTVSRKNKLLGGKEYNIRVMREGVIISLISYTTDDAIDDAIDRMRKLYRRLDASRS
jgi:hypothetical protein